MAETVSRDRLIYRLWYVIAALLAVFIHLLPFNLGAARFPGPDLLVLLAFAWVVRRPDYVPVLLVALVTLATDILFFRPPGLWTACVIVGLEFLRSRGALAREQPFLVEWFMVGATFCLMTMANAVALSVLLVVQPPLKLVALGMVVSVLCYPLVALATRYAFGIVRLTPGEADALGYRS